MDAKLLAQRLEEFIQEQRVEVQEMQDADVAFAMSVLCTTLAALKDGSIGELALRAAIFRGDEPITAAVIAEALDGDLLDLPIC